MAAQLDRIAVLARQPHLIFHTGDLRRLWNIKNLNTLYTLLTRYVKRGVLFRIYKGLYSLVSIDKLEPLLLGIKAIHSYAYVSTETVLVEEGVIAQVIYDHTLVSGYSRHFRIGQHSYTSRKLSAKFLYNPAGITEENGIMKATLERAVADLLYFNPRAYFDGIEIIDVAKVRALQEEIGYPLTKISNVTPS
jgi:predicted transcriptional regulator of viral defense system